MLTVNWPRLSE